MSGFEWFLLVVVVVAVPLVVAVAVTLWTLEQARQRKRQNRPATDPAAGPVKRKATRDAAGSAVAAGSATDTAAASDTLAAEMTEVAMGDDAIVSPAGDEAPVVLDGGKATTEDTSLDDAADTPFTPATGETTPGGEDAIDRLKVNPEDGDDTL